MSSLGFKILLHTPGYLFMAMLIPQFIKKNSSVNLIGLLNKEI